MRHIGAWAVETKCPPLRRVKMQDAVLEYFTVGTGLKTLCCCHAAENPASGRVLQKSGFICTHDEVYHQFNGQRVNAHDYIYQKE